MEAKLAVPAIAGGKPVRETKIFYGHQYLDEADYRAVLEVLKSDYLTCGPKIGELEEKLCRLEKDIRLDLSTGVFNKTEIEHYGEPRQSVYRYPGNRIL